MSEDKFVINVVNDDQKYIATSEYFPDCVGTSETEKGAVRKLKNLIMEHLKKKIKLGFKVLCSSDVKLLTSEDLFKDKIKIFDELLNKMAVSPINSSNSDHLIFNPDVRFNLLKTSINENQIPFKPESSPYFVSPVGSMEDNMGFVINLKINLN